MTPQQHAALCRMPVPRALRQAADWHLYSPALGRGVRTPAEARALLFPAKLTPTPITPRLPYKDE